MEINVPGNSASGNNVPDKNNKIINVIHLHFITCIYKKKFNFLGENVDESQQLQNTQNSPIEVVVIWLASGLVYLYRDWVIALVPSLSL